MQPMPMPLLQSPPQMRKCWPENVKRGRGGTGINTWRCFLSFSQYWWTEKKHSFGILILEYWNCFNSTFITLKGRCLTEIEEILGKGRLSSIWSGLLSTDHLWFGMIICYMKWCTLCFEFDVLGNILDSWGHLCLHFRCCVLYFDDSLGMVHFRGRIYLEPFVWILPV